MLPLQGAQVQSLVRELDPTSCNLGVHMPQLFEFTCLCVAVMTWHSQIKIKTADHLEKSCECCWSPNQPCGEHSRAAPAVTSPHSLTPQSCFPPNRKPEARGPLRQPIHITLPRWPRGSGEADRSQPRGHITPARP